MRARPVFIAAAALTMFLATLHAAPADRPARRPLDPAQRNAVLALMHAVDLAQETDVTSDGADLNADTLKASNQMAYVPFRVALKSIDNAKSAALYVRAVSREHGIRSKIERSALRDWVERGGGGPAPLQQSVAVGPGEMPVGGAGVSSRRQSIQAAAESSAILALQERELEKEKAAAEAARKKEENHERDPFLFPFEEYYFADVKGQMIDRALMLGAGQYDLFIAVVDRARLKTSSPVVIRRTIDVPDFWNDELRLSSVMLVKDMRQLAAPLPARDQADHPYTFGRLEILPTESTTFTSSDALSVLYQICNYGAPDVDVQADYVFYHDVNGKRTIFNRTRPQVLSDADLPQPANWQTQGFVMQTVPLAPFPAGRYELEITAHDRLTRSTATSVVTFTVK